MSIGLETSGERHLRSIAKNIDPAQVESCLRWCRELGIRTKLFMIAGLPGQNWSECIRDIRYIRDHRSEIDFFATTVGLRVYPGTALESRLKRENVIPAGFSWARYRAPKSNLLLFEPGNVMILKQKKLGIFRLVLIALRLVAQRTVMSGGSIGHVLQMNTGYILRNAARQVRYTLHVCARWLDPPAISHRHQPE